VAELYPNIKFDTMIIDNCCMQVSGTLYSVIRGRQLLYAGKWYIVFSD